MVARKKKKKADPSWDEIGKSIGKKIEMCSKDDKSCKSWAKHFESKSCCESGGGFFGRLLFIIGVVCALNATGVMTGLSWWILTLLIAGFALMKL